MCLTSLFEQKNVSRGFKILCVMYFSVEKNMCACMNIVMYAYRSVVNDGVWDISCKF